MNTLEKRQIKSKMHIFIKTASGRTISININEFGITDVQEVKVQDIKQKIANTWVCKIDEVKIVWAGKQMVDGLLKDYGFTKQEHSIHALFRPIKNVAGGVSVRPPDIQFPPDFHELSDIQKEEMVMVLTASREMEREKMEEQASLY